MTKGASHNLATKKQTFELGDRFAMWGQTHSKTPEKGNMVILFHNFGHGALQKKLFPSK